MACRALPGARSRWTRRSLACALASNARNRAIAQLLQSYGRIEGDPAEALELYTRQCSLNVTAKDLAAMGATLADGGVNPLTRDRVIDPESGKRALAVMATAGLYETSGDWLYDVGLPGRAASPAGSSRSRPARARWAPSRRGSTPRATASRAGSPPAFSRRNWA